MAAMKTGHVRIGISGWRYDGWRGRFYPAGWPQKRELEYASGAVQTIEINGTHYSLQSPRSFRSWYDETPEESVFSVKGARYLTHMLRFRDETATAECANLFAQGLLALDEKLGPIVRQSSQRTRLTGSASSAFSRSCRAIPKPRCASQSGMMLASKAHICRLTAAVRCGTQWRSDMTALWFLSLSVFCVARMLRW
jgi:uncharacterized protein YecE (DUF72 family)